MENWLNSPNSLLVVWLSILIFCVAIEIIITHLVTIWFSAGALAAIIANALGFNPAVQIILFTIVSIACIIASRPLAKKYLRTNVVNTNFDRVIGKHALVTKSMDADTNGEVKVMSTIWMANSVDNGTINEGEYCEVLAIEGAHLVVKKIER